MPASEFLIPHALGAEEARSRISQFVESAREHPGWVRDIQTSWTGDSGRFSLKVFGMAVSGDVEAQVASVRVRIEYPLAAAPLKDRIEREIIAKGRQLLSESRKPK